VSEAELREQICHIGRLLYRNHLIDSGSGNISARLPEGRILCTPSGLAKGFMRPEQLIVVNLEGERVDTPSADNAGLRPTSELPMHLECYRQREDVQGVVHAHPPNAVALTVSGHGFSDCVIPEAILLLGVIPGGSSTPILRPDEVVDAPDEKHPLHDWHGKSVLDVPLGVDTMRALGTMLGTCCALVLPSLIPI